MIHCDAQRYLSLSLVSVNALVRAVFDLFNEDMARSLTDARLEIQSRIHKLADSRWGSLGQYLDYSGWATASVCATRHRSKGSQNPKDRIYARSRQSRIVSIDCKLADACNTQRRSNKGRIPMALALKIATISPGNAGVRLNRVVSEDEVKSSA